MTEQQYRVIADRDKGDDPTFTDAQPGDRLTYTMPRSGPWVTHVLDRIERPVPTTAVWRDKQGDEWVEDAGGLMHSFETAPFPREHVEKKWGPLVPVGPQPSPHQPTREQIAETIEIADAEWMERTHPGATDRDWRLHLTDAVLALLNGADR